MYFLASFVLSFLASFHLHSNVHASFKIHLFIHSYIQLFIHTYIDPYIHSKKYRPPSGFPVFSCVVLSSFMSLVVELPHPQIRYYIKSFDPCFIIQLDMVDPTYAVFPNHLHLRREPQVPTATRPRRLGGTRDLLLSPWSCLHLTWLRLRDAWPRPTTPTHLSLQHAALLLFPYSNNLRSIYHFHRLNGLADATGNTTVVWLCIVVISDWHSKGQAGITTVILASFYLHNDFACSSNNKYLCRSIPVRWAVLTEIRKFRLIN